jgi:hypothetical protein
MLINLSFTARLSQEKSSFASKYGIFLLEEVKLRFITVNLIFTSSQSFNEL